MNQARYEDLTSRGEPKDASSEPERREIVELPAVDSLRESANVKMSFNPRTKEGAILLLKATLHECKKLEDMAGKELELVHHMSHPAESVDQRTGEAKPFKRIVVFDKSGEAYSCGSLGVDKSITIIEFARGKAPWNPPLKVTVEVRRLTNKNNWMVLVPDIDSLTNTH